MIFGGKAAPGYLMAKLIIRLITGVAEVVNATPPPPGGSAWCSSRLQRQERQAIYPAADLSEQISTAGLEASGTGNMKFMMNGALTIGTLDGANVEIRDEAGPENFFLFGLTADQVAQVRRDGYRPEAEIAANPELAAALDSIADCTFSGGDRERFRPLIDTLRTSDPFLVLADYAAYLACQSRVEADWRDRPHWTRMSILNTARSGKFSSDRSIRELRAHLERNAGPDRAGVSPAAAANRLDGFQMERRCKEDRFFPTIPAP